MIWWAARNSTFQKYQNPYFCKSLLIHSWFVNSCGIWGAASVTKTWRICCRLYQRWEVFVVSKKSFKEAEFSTKWRSSHLAAGCNVTFLDFFRWWSVATSSHRIYWQSSSTWSQSNNVTFLDFLDDDSLPLPATESIDSLPQRGASPAMLDFGIF